jgi:hypothetical protein
MLDIKLQPIDMSKWWGLIGHLPYEGWVHNGMLAFGASKSEGTNEVHKTCQCTNGEDGSTF